MNTLFALLALHFLCDFPLQGDFLARGKNCRMPIAGVPWQICLFAHAFIQAGGVALIVPLPFALAELGCHFLIDWCKCAGGFGWGQRAFWIDQALHVALRVLWAALAVTA